MRSTSSVGSVLVALIACACGGDGVAADAAPGSEFLRVDVTLTGSGVVTSSPIGIDCGSTCTASFLTGTEVTLTAVPDPSALFEGWTGACAGTGDCTIVVDSDLAVEARFTSRPWSLASQGLGDTEGFQMAIDADGSVVVAGGTNGFLLDLGGTNMLELGNEDVWVAKFTREGAHVWSKRLGGPERDFLRGLALTEDGYILLSGFFAGTATFAGPALSTTASDDFDVWVAKLDPDGAAVWSRSIGGTGAQIAAGVAIDPLGAVVVGGEFDGVMTFGGSSHPTTGNTTDLFIAKLSDAGDPLWIRTAGGDYGDWAKGVVAGTTYALVGQFGSTVDFGGGPLTSAGMHDVVIAWFDPAGVYLADRVIGGTVEDTISGIALDRNTNDVVVVGSFGGTVDFGGGPISPLLMVDMYVARYSEDGAFRWVNTYYNAHTEWQSEDHLGNQVVVNGAGEAVITGEHFGVDLGGGQLPGNGATSPDVFAAVLSPTGAHVWSATFGGTGSDSVQGVAYDEVDHAVALTGMFTQSIDFGSGAIIPTAMQETAAYVAWVVR